MAGRGTDILLGGNASARAKELLQAALLTGSREVLASSSMEMRDEDDEEVAPGVLDEAIAEALEAGPSGGGAALSDSSLGALARLRAVSSVVRGEGNGSLLGRVAEEVAAVAVGGL